MPSGLGDDKMAKIKTIHFLMERSRYVIDSKGSGIGTNPNEANRVRRESQPMIGSIV